MIHDLIIIGSGPAGYTAALYAGRADLSHVVFTGPDPGGQLMITTDVENYPGYPEGILGPDMMADFRKQAERFGTKVIEETVSSVDFTSSPFTVTSRSGSHQAKTIIISTGAKAKWLGLESEVTFGGYGVSACATCDGFFFRGKEVIVVGGGDTAMEEATFLARHASKVYVVHRRDEFRASKIMQGRVLSNPKIEVIWNSTIDEILGDLEPVKKVTGVRLKSTVDGSTRDMEIGGVFMAIGHQPNSSLFDGWLDKDDAGYLKVIPGTTQTQIPGVFACGDVMDPVYRQAVTAAGTGCMAAIEAGRYLEGHESQRS
ncbi:MAG: thioredoxin-disulfide reductase [Fimbriimonadaceae bacterium]|jgi:thioredoxin reductase (NADPH)|nr:thioredoxin-disulfide reductase [Fimbriimonadaceae bacterium]